MSCKIRFLSSALFTFLNRLRRTLYVATFPIVCCHITPTSNISWFCFYAVGHRVITALKTSCHTPSYSHKVCPRTFLRAFSLSRIGWQIVSENFHVLPGASLQGGGIELGQEKKPSRWVIRLRVLPYTPPSIQINIK